MNGLLSWLFGRAFFVWLRDSQGGAHASTEGGTLRMVGGGSDGAMDVEAGAGTKAESSEGGDRASLGEAVED